MPPGYGVRDRLRALVWVKATHEPQDELLAFDPESLPRCALSSRTRRAVTAGVHTVGTASTENHDLGVIRDLELRSPLG